MLRTAGILALLATACASHEPAASEPRRTPGFPVGQHASGWQWADSDTSAEPTHILIGRLGQLGTEVCSGDHEQSWTDIEPTIGRVGVVGPPDDALEPLMDRPVLARGRPSAAGSGATPPPSGTSCVGMQMRSDWRLTPRGIVRDRTPQPSVDRLEVTAVRELHELAVRPDGDHVLVTFNNPISNGMTGVELRVHYEGCHGKPMASHQTETIGNLGGGALASARMPLLLGDSEARASSVQLVAEGPELVVDLDVPLADFGIEPECTRR